MSEIELAPQPEPQPVDQAQPEPWTPQRVVEWNSYYDLYVVLGVLFLAFVVSANKITNSDIWAQLRAGNMIAAQRAPLVTDTFSFTETGRRWVNIPWLFEVSHAALYNLAHGLVKPDPADPAASAAKADQVGTGALVALNALARVLVALVLLQIRRPGPGLWWAAVCVALALGAVPSPAGLMLGGIALPGQVAPGTWGLLLLAIELFLIHRAIAFGRAAALWGLVPLFLLWANVDDSFLFGLLLLTAAVAGLLPALQPRGRIDVLAPPAPGIGRGVMVLAACVLVCFVNPSVHHAFPAAFSPLLTHFQRKSDVRTIEQLSFFSPALQEQVHTSGAWMRLVAFYVLSVATGLLSFLLNRRRFDLSRFLMFALASVLWGYLLRYSGEFALVFATTLALNGQEWYHDRYGSHGRLGRGWTVWSTGGRALTIVGVFVVVFLALTGYGSAVGDLQFGFGYDPDLFAFEAADYLKNAPIKGNVLNTTRRQGDALVWRAYPQRQSFIDNRHYLFPQQLVNELQKIRGLLKNNDKGQWQPLLDKYRISTVMLDIASSPVTYQQLMQTPDWVAFYDDGSVVLFGRTDAADAADVAFFKKNRLDAETMAFRQVKPVPAPDRPPSQTTWVDQLFRWRSLVSPQPHGNAARRWVQGTNFDSSPGLPTPAQCLLAIREARTALAHKPDDYEAFRILSACYRALMLQEAALIQGVKITPKNAAQIGRSTPSPRLVTTRFRQRATALNFAIQTTPPPRTDDERRALQGLNLDLFQLYLDANCRDLARDRLQAALESSQSGDLTPETHTALSQQLQALNDQISDIQGRMQDLSVERNMGPLERAAFAMRASAPGLAIQELEEADRTNQSPALVKPQLIDLYCDTGQPEKAAEVLGVAAGMPDDPSLGAEPGTAALRQGLVYFLLGNYEDAGLFWERRAIRALRFDRSERALAQLQTLLRGNPKQAVNSLQMIPGTINTQAAWEYDLALCRLESGAPDSAAEHFTKALELVPDMQARRLIAYYLEKMGKHVPPSTSEKEKQEQREKKEKKTDEPAKTTAKPANATSENADKNETKAEPAKANTSDSDKSETKKDEPKPVGEAAKKPADETEKGESKKEPEKPAEPEK